jgi:glycine/D-amino acid oxidase-like deaminating enzyme
VSDTSAGVAVVGAGIAGVATAFFILRSTTESVTLIERDQVARGATGRNAGQLTTYFERPLSDIAEEFGAENAIEAQRGVDSAHNLLDLMVAETGASVRIERFRGHMGMFNLNHVLVHLRNNLVRRQGGWRVEVCVVADDADYLPAIPPEFSGLYTVVPRAHVRELLEINDDRYSAVLSELKGCANSALLAKQALEYLRHHYGERFQFIDHSAVTTITAGADRMLVRAGGHDITCGHVALCTNGFIQHVVCDPSGIPVRLAPDQEITGYVGHMTGFIEAEARTPAAMSYIRNTTIGGETPYVYVTRRTWDAASDVVTLTCMGGPDVPFDPRGYDPDVPFPGELLDVFDSQVRPLANPSRPAGQPYDFQWHGLMGYNESGIRVVGAHPSWPRLLYNLGCNGVGFLPSIFGAHRLGQLLAGAPLAPSIFDPRCA